MSNFIKRLNELMKETQISANELSKKLNLATPNVIYDWFSNKKGQTLLTANKIANIFNCSLDFLYGKTEDNKYVKEQQLQKFGEQLKKILKACKVKPQNLIDNKVVPSSSLFSWLNNSSEPNMINVLKLADYLQISIDYLVGRD